MNRLFASLWRHGWLVAALLPLYVIPRSIAVWRDFARFGLDREIAPFEVHLGELAHVALAADLHRISRWFGTSTTEVTPIRELELRVEDEGELARDLPYSGRQARKGAIRVDARWLPADVRYRGDTFVHWGRGKKSWRVRLLGEGRFDGMQTLNLTVPKYPEQLNNHLGYWLASYLGLLAPRSELVLLRVNGSLRGSYFLVEQPARALLERNGRTPGVLFKGELLGRDAWTGVPNDLFVSAGSWQREVLGDGACPEADAALERLLDALRAPASEASIAAMAAVLDLQQFARFSLFEQITQTHHFDEFHNWRLHWDPNRCRFEPLVWDPVGWQENMRPGSAGIDHDPVFTILHERLHAHAGFLAQRDALVAGFFLRGGDRALVAQCRTCLAADRLALAHDPQPWPPDADAIASAQESFADGVVAAVTRLREEWVDRPPALRWRPLEAAGEILLEVASHRAAHGIRLRFAAPVAPRGIALVARRADGRDAVIDLAQHWQARGDVVELRMAFVSASTPVLEWRRGSHPGRNHRLAVAPTCYRIRIEGVDPSDLLAVLPGTDGELESPRAVDLEVLPANGLYALRELFER